MASESVDAKGATLGQLNSSSAASDDYRRSKEKDQSANSAGLDLSFTQNDRRDMQRMGKKQELRRNFRVITSIAFTSCAMGTWEILLTSNIPALTSGGSAGFFWSMVWVYVGQTFIVLSLAEMSSMAPTAGGQYHWVSEFAPRKYQKILSYISGWLASLCWQSFVTADTYICAAIIQSMAQLKNPDYDIKRYQTTFIMWAIVICVGIFNVFGARYLPLAEGLFAVFHVLSFIPIVAVLWVMAPNKNSSHDVFLNFSDNNTPGHQWPNMVLSVFVGQVSAMFTVLGSDSVAHISEEIKDAGISVPRSMIWAFVLNIPFALGILITLLYTVGNVSDAVASGSPFVYAFLNSTGSSSGTVGLTFVIFLLLTMITISTFVSTSRQTFAFARDSGYPFSSWIARVSSIYHIPVNSVIVTCAFTMLVSLINIGSTVALNAFLSLGVVSLMATYMISIGCVLLKRLRKEPLPAARWSLGSYGVVVNILALIYAAWAFFWSFWPTPYKPSADTFNWASVLFSGVMIISLFLYIIRGRKNYDGPVVKVQGREFE